MYDTKTEIKFRMSKEIERLQYMIEHNGNCSDFDIFEPCIHETSKCPIKDACAAIFDNAKFPYNFGKTKIKLAKEYLNIHRNLEQW